jgi:hypothetical protein
MEYYYLASFFSFRLPYPLRCAVSGSALRQAVEGKRKNDTLWRFRLLFLSTA